MGRKVGNEWGGWLEGDEGDDWWGKEVGDG